MTQHDQHDEPTPTPPPCGRSGAPRETRIAIALIGILTLVRLALAANLDLYGDEAYYWLWSKNLAASYFSKPAGVGWVIAAGTAFFGDTELGVRVFSVLFSALTSLCSLWLATVLYSARAGLWTVIVVNLLPLFVAGGLLMTTDAISVACWAAAMAWFWRFHATRGIGHWAATGTLIALGALGKPVNLLMIPSFALYLALEPGRGRLLRAPGFWLMTLVALCGLLPLLLWNREHGWVTLAHILKKGQLDRPVQLSLLAPLNFLGGQAGIAFPPFFVGLAIGLFHRPFRASAPASARYLTSLFAPVFVFYALVSLNTHAGENWTATAYVAGAVYLAAFAEWWTARSAFARIATAVSAGLAAVLVVSFLVLLMFIPIPYQGDTLERIRGNRSLGALVEEVRRETGAELLIGQHYQIAATLSFYMPGHPRAYTPPSPVVRNQFDLWPGIPDSCKGRDALFVIRENRVPDPVRALFESVEEPREIWTTFRGSRERRFHVFVCRNFRGKATR